MDWNELYHECLKILTGSGNAEMRLQALCDYLQRIVQHYDWFGFYFTIPGSRELALGPFSGEPTEHVRISYGQGICGQAAESGQTFLVGDVTKESNYLACSLKVKSEIVVPIFAGQTQGVSEGENDDLVIGEIDIDSHMAMAFTADDRAFLECLASAVAPLVVEASSLLR